MLKPDTNSDSPSAKSNGERFVSATQQINHIRTNGAIEKKRDILFRELNTSVS